MTGAERRCFDCFEEFDAGAKRFAVLKKVRDMPPDTDPVEARQLYGLLFDEVAVCEACHGWYGDESMEMEA